jgi:hypothetical protein
VRRLQVGSSRDTQQTQQGVTAKSSTH